MRLLWHCYVSTVLAVAAWTLTEVVVAEAKSVGQSNPVEVKAVQVIAKLRGGSVINGRMKAGSILVESAALGKMEIRLARVRAIQFGADGDESITFQNN
jgi:hypothetical protein